MEIEKSQTKTDNLKPTVRKAVADDVDLVYAMICDLEKRLMDRTNFDFVFNTNLNNEQVAYFIAEVGNEAVGMGSCHVQTLLHHASFVAEVQELFVYEAYRSKQIGKILMESLVDFAKSRGATQIEVSSRKFRESAHRFYEREGFENSHFKLVRYF
jgi:PhnO protein